MSPLGIKQANSSARPVHCSPPQLSTLQVAVPVPGWAGKLPQVQHIG